MRRAFLMRMLTALCAVCLAVLVNWQGEAVTRAEGLRQQSASVVVPKHQHHQEAILTDALQLYRICSSRPQRVISSQGSRTENTPFGWFARLKHHVKPLYSFYDSRSRGETAPFCMSASCEYYVIALRHILR